MKGTNDKKKEATLTSILEEGKEQEKNKSNEDGNDDKLKKMMTIFMNMAQKQLSVCMSVGPVSEYHSLLILGWWSSLPRELAIWTLDSVPMFKFLLYSRL